MSPEELSSIKALIESALNSHVPVTLVWQVGAPIVSGMAGAIVFLALWVRSDKKSYEQERAKSQEEFLKQLSELRADYQDYRNNAEDWTRSKASDLAKAMENHNNTMENLVKHIRSLGGDNV